MKHRFPSLLLVTLSGIAPAVLGSVLHWSAWQWGFMSMVTISGALLLVMTVLSGGRAAAAPNEPGEPEPPAPPTEQPYQETRVVDAPLPSASDGYDFLFSATVWWRPLPEHPVRTDNAPPALAVSSIVSRALEVVRHEHPSRASFARYVLEGELGVPLSDRSGRVKALAADVTLTLAPADRERLRKLNDLRKDEEVWEYERQHERNKRRYLGDDVLKSAGSAVVWWLARHENEIEKAVDMIGPLAQIAAAANDEEVPELFHHLLVPPLGVRSEATVGASRWNGDDQGGGMFDREEEVGVSDRLVLLLAALGLKPEMDECTVFVHRLVRSLEAAGLDEAAEEIRRTVLRTPEDGEADATGPSPDSPAEEASSSTDTTSDPDADVGTGTFTTGTAQSSADEGNQSWWKSSQPDMAPPPFRDTPHGPAAPHAGDEEGN
ncbi:hypothetical protein ACIQAC_11675 [Streptomyces sp. NPDC088387]|uniref:hypothetical protein n=1 Tax=Streptomyces sp. NPDC088387 TaxID=3365859 RepID=UPI003810C4AD